MHILQNILYDISISIRTIMTGGMSFKAVSFFFHFLPRTINILYLHYSFHIIHQYFIISLFTEYFHSIDMDRLNKCQDCQSFRKIY